LTTTSTSARRRPSQLRPNRPDVLPRHLSSWEPDISQFAVGIAILLAHDHCPRCFGPSTPSARDVIRQIAAIDSKRGIATDTGIPWKLPGDTVYFHEKTATGVIVMGWATYGEFAAPLHQREDFVLIADTAPLRTGFRPVVSLEQLVAEHLQEDVWVIGGATVYAQTIGDADELLLTQVVGDFGCTKFLPAVLSRLWSRDQERRSQRR